MTGATEVRVDALEVQQPGLEAPLLAQAIAEQIAGRISFRRAMRRAVQDCMRAGAKGIKVQCSGRLAGAEMARTRDVPRGSGAAHDAARRRRLRVLRVEDEVRTHRL